MSQLVAMLVSISSGGIIHGSTDYVNNTRGIARIMLIFLLYLGKPMEPADRAERSYRSGAVDFRDCPLRALRFGNAD